MALKNKTQLIVYPDRIGDNLTDLRKVLDCCIEHSIGGLHILPFFPSNADDGFSPITHKQVDPQFGSWKDITELSINRDLDLCVDLVLNHISDESFQFKDFLEKKDKSEYADLFVWIERDFPDMTEEDKKKIYIRKEKEPFIEVTFGDGTKGHVWATFTDHQIDLNFKNQAAWDLNEDYIKFLTSQGVNLFRLDAFGYITKKLGTSCFLVEPDVFDGLKWFRDKAKENGAYILPEVHGDYSYQVAISREGMYAYAFALPPLILHTFKTKSGDYLKKWLRQCPRQQITVLDTHDGICIPDVVGLLPKKEIDELVAEVDKVSGELIYLKPAHDVTGSVGAIYQLTTTFYDAMGRDDRNYIAARAIQMFTPGVPQIYYHGLVAGHNDFEMVEKTGDARSGNRHDYTLEEYQKALESEVSQEIQRIMHIRNTHPAFDGEFSLVSGEDHEVIMRWTHEEHSVTLYVNLETQEMHIS